MTYFLATLAILDTKIAITVYATIYFKIAVKWSKLNFLGKIQLEQA